MVGPEEIAKISKRSSINFVQGTSGIGLQISFKILVLHKLNRGFLLLVEARNSLIRIIGFSSCDKKLLPITGTLGISEFFPFGRLRTWPFALVNAGFLSSFTTPSLSTSIGEKSSSKEKKVYDFSDNRHPFLNLRAK